MTDGTTMSFTMCGFTSETSRYAKFMGTKGEVVVDMQPDERKAKSGLSILIRREQKKYQCSSFRKIFRDTAVEITGWWKNFGYYRTGEKTESTYIISLDRSLQSHYCALAANTPDCMTEKQ